MAKLPPPSKNMPDQYTVVAAIVHVSFSVIVSDMTVMLTTCYLCSLYGIKNYANVRYRYWDVVTVNFSSIFSRMCTASDFYQWQPWDARTESDCILGLDVTLERRLPQRCCLIGQGYDRPISVSYCDCNIDDYEWYVLVSSFRYFYFLVKHENTGYLNINH